MILYYDTYTIRDLILLRYIYRVIFLLQKTNILAFLYISTQTHLLPDINPSYYQNLSTQTLSLTNVYRFAPASSYNLQINYEKSNADIHML